MFTLNDGTAVTQSGIRDRFLSVTATDFNLHPYYYYEKACAIT